jgi:hypothetical protein
MIAVPCRRSRTHTRGSRFQRHLPVVVLGLVLTLAVWPNELYARRKNAESVPARIHFSANLEGELEPCSCRIPRGGLPRRAAFLAKETPDSLLTIIVDAGNFSPPGTTVADSVKARATAEILRMIGYDGMALGSREMALGVGMWLQAAHDSLPILAANLFADDRFRRPLLSTPFVVKRHAGQNIVIMGLVSDSAWKTCPDCRSVFWKDPFRMISELRKAAGKGDFLTVIGEFTHAEAESLARAAPEISMIVSSGLVYDEGELVSRSVLAGTTPHGLNANVVDCFRPQRGQPPHFVSHVQSLDESVGFKLNVLNEVRRIDQRIPVTSSNR